MSEFCIVNLHDMRVFTFCTPEEAPAQIEHANEYNNADIERLRVLLDYPANADGMFTRWLEEAEKKRGQYVGMTFDEFRQKERKKLLSLPLHEITEERFHEMLDVLPPIKWTRRDGVEMFCMSEMFTGTYSDQYAHDHNTGKFYCKLVDVCDPSTWINTLLYP